MKVSCVASRGKISPCCSWMGGRAKMAQLAFGSMIRECRRERNMNQTELAKEAGLSAASALSDIERGKKLPRSSTVEKLIGAMRCDDAMREQIRQAHGLAIARRRREEGLLVDEDGGRVASCGHGAAVNSLEVLSLAVSAKTQELWLTVPSHFAPSAWWISRMQKFLEDRNRRLVMFVADDNVAQLVISVLPDELCADRLRRKHLLVLRIPSAVEPWVSLTTVEFQFSGPETFRAFVFQPLRDEKEMWGFEVQPSLARRLIGLLKPIVEGARKGRRRPMAPLPGGMAGRNPTRELREAITFTTWQPR